MKVCRISLLVLGIVPTCKGGFVSSSPPSTTTRHSAAAAAKRDSNLGPPLSSSPPPRRLSKSLWSMNPRGMVEADPSASGAKSRGRPWRRVISKVLPRRRQANVVADPSATTSTNTGSTSVMQMKRLEEEMEASLRPTTRMLTPMNDTTAFLLHNFQNNNPQQLFGTNDLASSSSTTTNNVNNDFAASWMLGDDLTKQATKTPSGVLPLVTVDTNPSAGAAIAIGESSLLTPPLIRSSLDSTVAVPAPAPIDKDYEGGSPLTRITRLWFQSILHGLLCRWSVEPPEGLRVRVSPRGSVLGRLLARGQFRLNAEIDFDRIVFEHIRLSGGKISAKRMSLNLWSFAPHVVRFSIPRYPTQFELSATDCTLTQDDLLKSSCIRNGLQNLLIRILNGRGIRPADVSILALDILPSGKLSCRGQATSLFGKPISFEVRSGMSISTRGHVLTFPGLEISLGNTFVFVPIVPEIDLDIGHNARLRDICIDGRQRLVRVSATATICPEHTRKLSRYIQSTNAYSALFAFDVGQWLTHLGRFTH